VIQIERLWNAARIAAVPALLGAAFLSAHAAVAAPTPPPRYSISLAGPAPSSNQSEAGGMNAQGDVGGNSDSSASAQTFRFRQNGLIWFGSPQGTNYSFTYGINDYDDVAVAAGPDRYPLYPYLGFPHGKGVIWRQLLAPKNEKLHGTAAAINDQEDAVGYYYDGKNNAHAVIWTRADSYKPRILSVPTGTVASYVYALDNSGDSAGQSESKTVTTAAVWEASGHRDALVPMKAGDSSAGSAVVRTSSQPVKILVGGTSGNAKVGSMAAAIWTLTPSAKPGISQSAKPLVIPSPAGHPWCVLNGINAAGIGAGECDSYTNSIATVAIGGVQHNLNSLIPAKSGWTLWSAKAINAKGEIAGIGSYKGQEAAFLLTPK